MNPLLSVTPETLLSGTSEWFTPEIGARLAHHPLSSIETEYPHYVGSVESAAGPVRPKQQHPVFYGCFDWHSAVHSHWALIRQLRLFDNHPDEREITACIDSRLTEANISQEVAYIEANPSFEKPYGWGWLLLLAGELSLWDDDRADRWGETLEPLEQTIRTLVNTQFLTQERPFWVGTHTNTAFALHCVLDYARTVSNDSLDTAVRKAAIEWYGDDTSYPVRYEPLGWDFLSPALTEADLMRRVYSREEFIIWMDDFFPDLTVDPHRTVLDPIDIPTDTDTGAALHFAGLNISKAWCLAELGSVCTDHPYESLFNKSAQKHAQKGLSQAFTDDYAGSHWLSSFVLYLCTRNEAGVSIT